VVSFPGLRIETWGTRHVVRTIVNTLLLADANANGPPILNWQAIGIVAMSGLVERYVGGERGVFAGVAYADYELAGVDGPLVICFVPVAEGAGVEG
jgi:hypothetical protein